MLVCVKCPVRGASLVVLEDVLWSVLGKISEPTNVHCGLSLMRSAALLIRVPYQLERRQAYIGSDWLPVRCIGCVHWLVVVYPCLSAGRLIKVEDRN